MSANASQRVKGRVAVVAGGAQGIAWGSRHAWLEGAILVISDINEKRAPRTADFELFL